MAIFSKKLRNKLQNRKNEEKAKQEIEELKKDMLNYFKRSKESLVRCIEETMDKDKSKDIFATGKPGWPKDVLDSTCIKENESRIINLFSDHEIVYNTVLVVIKEIKRLEKIFIEIGKERKGDILFSPFPWRKKLICERIHPAEKHLSNNLDILIKYLEEGEVK